MRRLLSIILVLMTACLSVLTFSSCEREPLLHLHHEQHIKLDFPLVQLDLKVFWNYDLSYDWHAEWTYDWDYDEDDLEAMYGYHEPNLFHLRRYYLGNQQNAKHSAPDEFHKIGNTLTAEYKFGYYDILVWNEINTAEAGIMSLQFDETTTYDSVMVFTNATSSMARYNSPRYTRAFNQPEELFAAYHRNLHISDKKEDYDYYDPETNTYYMYADMTLLPVTYIYLTQVRLHNNKGRIAGVDGEANLSGMARGACLNSGLATRDPISVHYDVGFKKNCKMKSTGELVDVAGGRCLTFGIPNQNSSRVSRASDVKDNIQHYMEVKFIFNNGIESSMVFDVTEQVRARYKGGVITIDLDVDDIEIPTRPGSSGFDAVVKDYEEEEWIIPM